MTAIDEVTTRTPRQRELRDAAVRLFAEHGYHRVGVNAISGALGLTGPAFYRHYRSKEALLVAILEDAIVQHLTQAADLARAIPDARTSLEAIVAHHARFVLDQSANIITWRTEFLNLPAADRRRLRFLQRLYTEEWVRAVARQRPELDVEQVRVMCHGAIALIQSVTEFSNRMHRDDVERMLVGLALNALVEAPVRPTASTMGTEAAQRSVRVAGSR